MVTGRRGGGGGGVFALVDVILVRIRGGDGCGLRLGCGRGVALLVFSGDDAGRDVDGGVDDRANGDDG